MSKSDDTTVGMEYINWAIDLIEQYGNYTGRRERIDAAMELARCAVDLDVKLTEMLVPTFGEVNGT